MLALGVVSASLLQVHTIHAQSAQNQTSGITATEGMQISPARVELNAEPGKTYTVPLKVTNVTSSNLTFTYVVNDFGQKNETGTPNIMLDDVPRSASIKQWVQPISTFNLKPGEEIAFDATLKVPADAEPGGHYGIVRFSGNEPNVSGNGVGLSASAGTIFLVRVAGDIKEQVNLITFSGAKGDSFSNFFESGPVTLVTRFKNTGNVHVKPTGHIEVRDIFGNVAGTLDVNKDLGNVLPGSVRRFESTLKDKPLFGPYTAHLSIGYGTAGQAITEDFTFWVIPYKPILLGLLSIVTLFFVIRLLVKRYNRYIISQVTGNHGKDSSKKKKR